MSNNQYKEQSLILTLRLLDRLLVFLDLLCWLGFVLVIVIFLILSFFIFSFFLLLLFSEVEEKSVGVTVLEFSSNIEEFMDIGLAVEKKSEEGVLNSVLFVLELFLDHTDRFFGVKINFALNLKSHIAEVVSFC